MTQSRSTAPADAPPRTHGAAQGRRVRPLHLRNLRVWWPGLAQYPCAEHCKLLRVEFRPLGLEDEATLPLLLQCRLPLLYRGRPVNRAGRLRETVGHGGCHPPEARTRAEE